MPHEHLIINAAIAGIGILLDHRRFETRRPRQAIRPDQQLVVLRRDLEAAHPALEMRQLQRRAASNADRPDRILAAFVGLEIHGLAVMRELRRSLVDIGLGDQLFRGGPFARQVEPPQIEATTIDGQVGLALLPHQPMPIGRNSRSGDTRQRGHIVDRELAGDRRRGNESGRQSGRSKQCFHERRLQQNHAVAAITSGRLICR
ncbi:hypothetical protein D9M73_116790 [compost metagenome]